MRNLAIFFIIGMLLLGCGGEPQPASQPSVQTAQDSANSQDQAAAEENYEEGYDENHVVDSAQYIAEHEYFDKDSRRNQFFIAFTYGDGFIGIHKFHLNQPVALLMDKAIMGTSASYEAKIYDYTEELHTKLKYNNVPADQPQRFFPGLLYPEIGSYGQIPVESESNPMMIDSLIDRVKNSPLMDSLRNKVQNGDALVMDENSIFRIVFREQAYHLIIMGKVIYDDYAGPMVLVRDNRVFPLIEIEANRTIRAFELNGELYCLTLSSTTEGDNDWQYGIFRLSGDGVGRVHEESYCSD